MSLRLPDDPQTTTIDIQMLDPTPSLCLKGNEHSYDAEGWILLAALVGAFILAILENHRT